MPILNSVINGGMDTKVKRTSSWTTLGRNIISSVNNLRYGQTDTDVFSKLKEELWQTTINGL